MRKRQYETMKAEVTLTFGTAEFSPRLAEVLQAVGDTGSLYAAAQATHHAFSAVWTWIHGFEHSARCRLVKTDGARGSTLTEDARHLIELHHAATEAAKNTWKEQ